MKLRVKTMLAACVAGVALAGTWVLAAGLEEKPVRTAFWDAKLPHGMAKRVPWTTSNFAGIPGPPAEYQLDRVYPKLHFDRSLDMTLGPGGQRWYISEDPGLIWSFPVGDQDVERAELFMDIRRKDHQYIGWWEQRRLWSIAFHPKFAENGYVFVCYNDPKPQPTRVRISRFQVDLKNNSGTSCDVESERIIFEWVSPVDHNGGCMKFGPDGMLYFTAGDGGPIADFYDTGQDISDINASVLRIDVDHEYKGKPYSIPKDNPFVNVPGARGEVWAYGTRNIWKMNFDRKTGDLWGGDVGQDLWEMVLKIEKGGNYGWSITEGTHPFRTDRKLGPTPILPPVFEHEHSEARSITGGVVYRGSALPKLEGAYVYGDYEMGKVWALKYDGKKVTQQAEIMDTPRHIVSFAEDGDGEAYVLDYGGTIHKMVVAAPIDPAKPRKEFPKLLSQTGLFTDTKALTPAAGLVAYDVNSPVWHDGAEKQRWLAVPGSAKIDYDKDHSWNFPEGTTVVQHLTLDVMSGKRGWKQRVETRVMNRYDGNWRGYTYVWNDEQTDATLLEDKKGMDKTFKVADASASGGVREQVWHVPSRAECTLCHTMPANYTLGLSTAQLNRDHDYNGVTENQVRAFEAAGFFPRPVIEYHRGKDALGKEFITDLPQIADPMDAKAPLNDRARSYLHANCSHCHMRSGGGNSAFELPYNLSLGQMQVVNTDPLHGTLGFEGAKIVAPGDPGHSLLALRMGMLGGIRMPRVGSYVVDVEGMKLIIGWVEHLNDKPKE
jgi:uncharacterized repeat protein (TIGR03806 family)